MLNRKNKTVEIVNDYYLPSGRATNYDWNTGGGKVRSTAIMLKKRKEPEYLMGLVLGFIIME